MLCLFAPTWGVMHHNFASMWCDVRAEGACNQICFKAGICSELMLWALRFVLDFASSHTWGATARAPPSVATQRCARIDNPQGLLFGWVLLSRIWPSRDTGVYTERLVGKGLLKKNQDRSSRWMSVAAPLCGVGAPALQIKSKNEEDTMRIDRKLISAVALAASVGVLAGCKNEEKVAPPAASTTPAPTSPAAAAPAASPSVASASATMPAECEAYLTKVNACMDKLGSSNPAAASVKQQLDAAKTQWAAIPDKTKLAAQCKQSTDLFSQSASQMGCP